MKYFILAVILSSIASCISINPSGHEEAKVKLDNSNIYFKLLSQKELAELDKGMPPSRDKDHQK